MSRACGSQDSLAIFPCCFVLIEFIRDMRGNAEPLGVRAHIWLFALLGVGAILVMPQLRHESAPPKRPAKANVPHTEAAGVRFHSRSHPSPLFYEHNSSGHHMAAMLQRLSDPDANVRLKTLEALEVLKLPENETVPLLITCLADVDPRVRASAALRLGSLSMAARDAVPALKHLAKMDSDELVRSRAKDALFNIRFYDFSNWQDL